MKNSLCRFMRQAISCLTCLLMTFGVSHANTSKILDLTYPFNEKTIYWPTEKGFHLEKFFYGITPKGYFYSAYHFCAPEHGGTHIDAPRHFSKIGFPVDKIPVTQLIGNAVVIHVEKNVENHPDYAITLADIQAFEKQYRSLSPQDIVIFYTGWGQYWRDKKHYLGTDKFGDVKNLHFPGLSPEAARYLVMKKVKGVGLDTPSLDPGISNDFQAHQIILRANLFGVENIAHLGKLPPVGAKLIVAPMKIEGGSGAPTRVFALLQIGAKPLSV
ncbi:MAG: cyclase family protein [Legionellales bacterium]|nr:cyclase family protein [Legionellales bacterium]